jgi:hypothetical protein
MKIKKAIYFFKKTEDAEVKTIDQQLLTDISKTTTRIKKKKKDLKS